MDILKGRTTTAVILQKTCNSLIQTVLVLTSIFRSGDQSILGLLLTPGEQGRFNSPYRDITKDQFDTISVIPDSDNKLDSLDFTQDDTHSWGYFNFPLLETSGVWSLP